MREEILKLIRETSHNQIDLYQLGKLLLCGRDRLCAEVDAMRRELLLTASAREGRYGVSKEQQAYTTADGCGLVSIRE